MKKLTPPLILFALVLCLVTIGIFSVYSASASPGAMLRQLAFAVGGLVVMLIFYNLDYQILRRYSLWIMLIGLVLCLLVFVPHIGSAAVSARRNAHRWINLRILTFQPSELAKVALVIYMSAMLADRRMVIKSFQAGVVPALVITAIFALVIVVEPDLGAAFTLSMAIFGMWFAAEMRWFHLIGLVSAGIPAVVAAIFLEPWRVKRVLAFTQLFFDPDKVDQGLIRGILYQLYQSLIAVGSGGMWGLGAGHSMQKYYFPTEAHTDFIFAMMCEEYGFVMISLIILIYVALVLIGWYIALNIPDLFGSLLASGITMLFFTSATINMCVVIGLLPTKGLVFPFFSAGGSSLLINMASAGILMNIGRYQYTHNSKGRVR